jgi:hypothetical protein
MLSAVPSRCTPMMTTTTSEEMIVEQSTAKFCAVVAPNTR